MSYINDIFERLNLQQIREFLLHGVECCEVSGQTYQQRLREAEKPISEMMEKQFPDKEENDKVSYKIYHYASVMQDVYMEIGMQCGVILAMQLFTQKE